MLWRARISAPTHTDLLSARHHSLQEEFEDAFEHDKHLVRYQIIDDVLYRTIGLNGTEEECLFPARCRGIEFMLLKVGSPA